jgi:1-aminocyclopropane-1-carboxylate deaminase
VKRDDELGFGVSGSKHRKYLSLLPCLLKEKPEMAVVTGSAYSNHVLSISQLLIENGVEPVLFLLGHPSSSCRGNLLYSRLLADPKNVHWFSKDKWGEIDAIAEEFANARQRVVVVPKGANCKEALPGALTLPKDILRNEVEQALKFDHIFIDAGTGMTAAALILAFEHLKRNTTIHVIQMAGSGNEFLETLGDRKGDFEELIGERLPFPLNFKLYLSRTPFGAVNREILRAVARLAKEEGFLTDPVFTAKLFEEGKKVLEEGHLEGNILFIHSGGGLGLSGFQEEIAKTVLENDVDG